MGSLLVIVGLFSFSLYTCIKYKFFKSKFTKIFRLIQEGSFVIIMICINVFYFDSELQFIQNAEIKFYLVMIFGILVCTNILLEIISAIKEVISMIFCKKKKDLPKSSISAKKLKLGELMSKKGKASSRTTNTDKLLLN